MRVGTAGVVAWASVGVVTVRLCANRAERLLLDGHEPAKDLEALGVAAPSTAKIVDPEASPGPAQHDRRDDHVVRRADDRDEVRDQVDGADEIDQQATKDKPHAPRRRVVGEEVADQSSEIRNQPKRGLGELARWLMEPQERNQDQPPDRNDQDRNEKALDRVHMPILVRRERCGTWPNNMTSSRPTRVMKAIIITFSLAIAGLLGACSSRTTPALPVDPQWTGGGCRGTGTDVIIHGSITDPRVTWVTTLDGRQRVEIVWPVGYSARFVPGLEVLDARGTVVAWEGDHLGGWCRTADTPANVPIWVEGREVVPASGLPSSTA
jgi:hypothetical protein